MLSVFRAVQRWASASADFARRHNPVNPIVHSRTVTRLKGWRPFNREGQQASYKDEATSTKGDGDNDSGLSQLEGGMGQLVHYLMPQVFIVAIFRKAQQVPSCYLLCTCKYVSNIPRPQVLLKVILLQGTANAWACARAKCCTESVHRHAQACNASSALAGCLADIKS